MSVFDFPTAGAPWDEVAAEMQRVREYLRTTPDPNEVGDNGRTLLQLALILCSTDEGESLVIDLLQRGADPNRPSAWATFTLAVSVSSSLPVVKQLLESGLRLNEVYEISSAEGELTDGPSTLLDHLYGIRDYTSPRRKRINALANKYAGGLGKRRRFIEEAIALLEANAAKRAADLAQG